ncbi:helix-turn-helix transcriptional regulator [Jannaschia sp. LMIT008]|uniref:response regulator transcription factor n=1 Tax=Jannaschia maritima TaxID=3032585 RepID=UPI0028116001|nr:helix-turn-helix transcriptional regulator [Jannaschia sp. LMIT008]
MSIHAPLPVRATPIFAECPLTPREVEVLIWVARGKSGRDIGVILGISVHTVDTLVRRILDRLDTASRTTAAVRAAQNGWLPPV